MTAHSQENKACPFCGKHLLPKNQHGYYVHPENDCIVAGHEYDDDGSIQKWNTRVIPTALDGVHAALERCRACRGFGEHYDIERDVVVACPRCSSPALPNERGATDGS